MWDAGELEGRHWAISVPYELKRAMENGHSADRVMREMGRIAVIASEEGGSIGNYQFWNLSPIRLAWGASLCLVTLPLGAIERFEEKCRAAGAEYFNFVPYCPEEQIVGLFKRRFPNASLESN